MCMRASIYLTFCGCWRLRMHLIVKRKTVLGVLCDEAECNSHSAIKMSTVSSRKLRSWDAKQSFYLFDKVRNNVAALTWADGKLYSQLVKEILDIVKNLLNDNYWLGEQLMCLVYFHWKSNLGILHNLISIYEVGIFHDPASGYNVCQTEVFIGLNNSLVVFKCHSYKSFSTDISVM